MESPTPLFHICTISSACRKGSCLCTYGRGDSSLPTDTSDNDSRKGNNNEMTQTAVHHVGIIT